MNSQILQDLVKFQMPYGKYKGFKIINIPTSYLEWHHKKGFPKGRLGMFLHTLYEIKINGLSDILTNISTYKND